MNILGEELVQHIPTEPNTNECLNNCPIPIMIYDKHFFKIYSNQKMNLILEEYVTLSIFISNKIKNMYKNFKNKRELNRYLIVYNKVCICMNVVPINEQYYVYIQFFKTDTNASIN